MDIVDSQIHFGPGGTSEIIAAMDAIGIRSSLIDEWWTHTPSDPQYEIAPGVFRRPAPSAELAAWTHPERFAWLLRVDPRDPELRAVARIARDTRFCRALRVAPAMSRADIARFAAGDYDPVFAAASETGLPIFAMVAGHAELIGPYLDRWPDVRVIICHTGMPMGAAIRPAIIEMEGLPDSEAYWTKVGEEPLDAAFDRVLTMADRPNVALKWAHAAAMFDAVGYPNAGARPFLRKAIDRFGADRVMFGSDYSAAVTGESWAELVFAIRDNPELDAEEKAWVLGRTARTWLDWPA